MHVRSLLPVLGLTLVAIVSAQDNSTDTDIVHGIIGGIPNQKREFQIRGTSAPIKRAQKGICDALPNKWQYQGCYSDSPSLRVLSGASYCEDGTGAQGLTQEKCIEFCDQKGYSLAGVEWGKECYCGYTLDSSSKKADESDCSKPCTGNDAEVCGEGGRINIFTNGDSAPAILAATGDYTSLGCYTDSPSGRALTKSVSLPGNVRVSDCTTACEAQGYSYAGLEFGKECWCGASIQNGNQPTADSKCNMACTADKTQYCGGAGAINIYKSNQPQTGPSTIPAGWNSQGCYTDSASARSLPFQVPGFSKFSNAQCVSECAGRGYIVAGSEYGSECFCGNSVNSPGQPDSRGCDMACQGNKADVCGGAGHLSVFQQDCQGQQGCVTGYGILGQVWRKDFSLHDCYNLCKNNPDCRTFQFSDASINSYAGYNSVCNILRYAPPVVYAEYTKDLPGCDVYKVYSMACQK